MRETSAHADSLAGEELPCTTQLTIGGEDVPLLGQSLVMNLVAEPAERALAADRPQKPLPQGLVALPLSE